VAIKRKSVSGVLRVAKLKLLIAGGGSTAEILLNDPAIREVIEEVIVVESNSNRRKALEKLGDIYVIEGDAADASIYNAINMREITAVLALTNKDEVNFLVLAIAKMHNVPIRIGVFSDEDIARAVRSLKLGVPIIKPTVTAGVIKQIVSSITSPKKYLELPLAEYKLYAITIGEDDMAVNSKIEELNLEESGAYPLLIFNGKELVPATPETVLHPGYTLFIMARDENFINKIKG